MKKTMLFVILDKYSEWESAYLSSFLLALGQDSFSVKTVSLTKDKVKSLGGFTTLPDYDIKSAPIDFEALILVGGMSWRTKESQEVKFLVDIALKNKKVLAGICDASVFLGKIGILNNIHHTSNDLNDLKQYAKEMYTGEAKYLKEEAVCDNNIITANGTASLEFAREVLLALKVAPESTLFEWYNFYKRGPYKAPMPSM